jgi:hypothetical protein
VIHLHCIDTNLIVNLFFVLCLQVLNTQVQKRFNFANNAVQHVHWPAHRFKLHSQSPGLGGLYRPYFFPMPFLCMLREVSLQVQDFEAHKSLKLDKSLSAKGDIASKSPSSG